MGFVLAGLPLALIGVTLMARYEGRPGQRGFGDFSLLPLSGLVYLLGVLMAIVGTSMSLIGVNTILR